LILVELEFKKELPVSDGYASILKNRLIFGRCSQICINAGPSAGGACYAPGLLIFIFMIDKISQMYITGPEELKK
jgi:acetyl-CoA carboxylase carboxyltransferase component